MRKVMAAALLAATVLAPMAANAQDRDGRGGGWHGRAEGGHPQAARQAQGQPAQQQPQAPAQPQAQVQPGGGYGARGGVGGAPGQRGGYRFQPGQQRASGYQPGADQPRAPGQFQGQRGGQFGQPSFRGPGGDGGSQFVQSAPQDQAGDRGRGYGNDGRGGYQGYAGRGGYPGGYAGARGAYGNLGFNADRRDFGRDQARFAGRSDWNRGWRNDGRYNYNSYRQSHYDLFRLPRYEAPYGYSYGYRRFGIGATLGDIFFAEDYWIDDPYDYRLPPAYGPYRWVRYYGDALLVDIDTGEVVDSVYGIFG